MKIHLKELFDIEGDSKEIDCLIKPEEIKNELGEYSSYDFTVPIRLNGRVFNRAGIVTLDYEAGFTLALVCDRCLKEFEREFDYDFHHTLVRGLQNEDLSDEYVVCEDNVLDLNELAMADIILQLPTKILCKEDCKGLCFRCGQDLNEGSCDCPK